MTLETIFIFTMSLILLWIKPGPGQALKITTVLNSGFLAGFYIVLGIITGCIIFFLVAVLGASFVTGFFNDAGFFLKLIGSGYLTYLGIKGFKNINKGQWTGRTEKSSAKKFIENYPLGLFTNLANPLPIFFFLSIIPTLVPIGDLEPSDIIVGIIIIILVGLIIDGLLLFLVHQVKEALAETKIVKRLNMVTSIGFILIGLFLLYSAFFENASSFNLL